MDENTSDERLAFLGGLGFEEVAEVEPGRRKTLDEQGRLVQGDVAEGRYDHVLIGDDSGQRERRVSPLIDEDTRQNYADAVLDTLIAVMPKEALLNVMNRRTDLSLRITKLVGMS